MLSDALRYPLEGDSWIRTILIGGLLTILSVLILPWFFLQGYYVRVLHGVTNDDPAPPTFTDWVALLVDGVKLFVLNILVAVVILAVQIAVGIAMGTGPGLTGSPPATNPGATGGMPGQIGAVGLLVFLGAVLVISYVVPAMLANFGREQSLTAAFDASTVLSGALSREYLIAWVLAVAVGLVLGFVGGLLSLLVVGIFGLFYVQLVTYYLFGRGFAAGLEANGGDADAVTY
ncbi:hypothetical protein GCM10008995_05490 [Halobellus salinus]|uniref:DUF4013 domain-containing protein n=1 Tax=Halobellus salinus TaxID=931585 RepID=A0A830ED28_9EURY|nr:DUF4013 domain-containing protein [Halobellus salinus]GGI98525.1 hypothetical protein GCM10008995_05490 [Halobellus salinus]SMP05930.1 Protein of unknown function [Halobellus salinus]